MHVRAMHVRGLAVVEESTQSLLGVLDLPLIDPDTGKIHGFFVHSAMPGTDAELFLSTLDILSWGTKVHVRGPEQLAPPHELVRLSESLADGRTVLRQPIRTRPARVTLGRCTDVQFDTKTFLVEWLFPRRFFRIGNPIPTTEILEITKNAIWVRDPLRPRTQEVASQEKGGLSMTKKISEAPAAARTID